MSKIYDAGTDSTRMHSDRIRPVPIRSRAATAVQCLVVTCFAISVTTVPAMETRKLTEATAEQRGLMGFASAMYGDAAFAGAPGSVTQSGVGYVFDIDTGDTLFTLKPDVGRADNMFGFNSRMSSDKLLVGDPGNPFGRNKPVGLAHVFDIATGEELFRLTPTDSFAGDEFGFGINMRNDLAIIGAPNLGTGVGAAYLFDLSDGSQLRKLTPNDPLAGSEFGADVAVSTDYSLVGAPANFDTLGLARGFTYVFDTTDGDQLYKLQPNDSSVGDEFGFDVAIDGKLAVIGSPNGGSGEGAAYLFDVSTGQQLFKLTPNDNVAGSDFGSSVDISGSVVAVGASGLNSFPGAVYLFDTQTGQQVDKLAPTDLALSDAFGISVALYQQRLLVGSPRNDEIAFNAGAAYVFDIGTTPLIGDFNGNGQLDVDDLDQLTVAVVTGGSADVYDMDGNGLLDQLDRDVWVNDRFGTYFGDANLDGVFDSGDLIQILAGGEFDDATAGNSTWSTGDFNGDLDFSSGDIIKALQDGGYNQGRRTAILAVPEPSSWLLLLTSLAGGGGFSRRCKTRPTVGC